jgi:hypothetical protein
LDDDSGGLAESDSRGWFSFEKSFQPLVILYARVDNVPSVSSPVKNYFQVDLGVEKEAKGVWGVVMIAWKSECDELVRMDEVDS